MILDSPAVFLGLPAVCPGLSCEYPGICFWSLMQSRSSRSNRQPGEAKKETVFFCHRLSSFSCRSVVFCVCFFFSDLTSIVHCIFWFCPISIVHCIFWFCRSACHPNLCCFSLLLLKHSRHTYINTQRVGVPAFCLKLLLNCIAMVTQC